MDLPTYLKDVPASSIAWIVEEWDAHRGGYKTIADSATSAKIPKTKNSSSWTVDNVKLVLASQEKGFPHTLLQYNIEAFRKLPFHLQAEGAGYLLHNCRYVSRESREEAETVMTEVVAVVETLARAGALSEYLSIYQKRHA